MSDRDVFEATVVYKDPRGTFILPDGIEPHERNRVRCVVPGALKKRLLEDGRVKVVVGDRVRCERLADGTARVQELLPRRSVLVRRRARDGNRPQITAANMDRIACVVAARDPAWKPGFVDRVMCAAQLSDTEFWLVINKLDLLSDSEREQLDAQVAIYEQLGVAVLRTSTETGEGIEALRERVRGSVTVVSGPSGVGKSSLLNRLGILGEPLATSEISRRHRKGRHTTTSAKWLALEGGGAVIDTPGVRAFGFYDLEPEDLDALFPDIRRYAYAEGDLDRPRCRFGDCTHREEPGCAVREAVERGEIAEQRYASYLRIFASLLEEAGRRR
ncbi:MAG: ribosome small subunit-dependent GTPase A [Planctomycetota bacterium]|nr:MAG: ribosome small subunit-dependent GTPase A [Planctomycetota bacterium]